MPSIYFATRHSVYQLFFVQCYIEVNTTIKRKAASNRVVQHYTHIQVFFGTHRLLRIGAV